jgi:folate-binding protein YgfZ
MALVRDLSARGRLVLTGPDRVRFLHGMVTNDVEALAPGAGCHAAMLTPKGKLQADLVIYADADQLLVELDAPLREKIAGALARHLILDDVELADVTDETRELGVYGDGAAAAIAAALGAPVPPLPPYGHVGIDGVRVARASELGPSMTGYHLIAPRERALALAIDAEILTDDEFEARRIEAGTPLYGVDMSEDRLPIEAGLTDAVSFTKGCYLGQEVIARATNLGHINKRLVGLLLDGEGAVARGARISGPGRPEAGVVTSSVVSPRLGRAIALGYVHRTLWDEGTALTILDGAHERPARVTALPFVRAD